MAEYANNVVLPVYMVIDSSVSMEDAPAGSTRTPFREAVKIAKDLYDALEGDPFISDRMRTGILFFDEYPRPSLPLSEPDSLDDWYDKHKDTSATGRTTSYSRVFEFLKNLIDEDTDKLRKEGGGTFAITRPLVLFLTDGKPMELNKSVIDGAFEILTAENNKYRPNIICIGVGEATREILGKYSAGTIHDSNSKRTYMTGNPKMAIFPQVGGDAAAAIRKISDKLVRTVIESVPKGEVELNSDGIAEIIVPIEDEFAF